MTTPAEIASQLVDIVERLRGQDESDPWFLTCQLLLGAAFSLRRGTTLFPPADPDLSGQTRDLARSLAFGENPIDGAFPTWTLGFYLNSAEFRVQSALHRLLRAYTGDNDGDAIPLARAIIPELNQQTDSAAKLALEAFVEEHPRDTSPNPLRRLWWRANQLKHNEAHDPSFFARFPVRFADALVATETVIGLVKVLGTKRAQLVPQR